MANDQLDLLAVQVFSWSPQLETVGEICIREATAGTRVGFVFIDIENTDEFGTASRSNRWLRQVRLMKIRRLERILRSRGVRLLPVARERRPLTILSSAEAGIDCLEQLRAYRVEGAALGIGVLGSLVHRLGDCYPDLQGNRELVDGFLNSAYGTFNLTRRLIDRYRPRSLLVSNGRLASSKGTTEAARLSGVDVSYCELGANFERYYLSNRPPQSFENARIRLRESWLRAGEEREAIAASFFTPDRGGIELPFAHFLDRQQRGFSIPSNALRRLVYYASSDDEHAAVEDGMEHPIFGSQREAVTWLLAWVRDHPDFELIIRIHPRMRVLAPRELQWWESLSEKNTTVLPADHHVDSYALAVSAEKVLCYRSSMGPEATYIGRPAIVLGDAVYRGLDCVYEPSSVAELTRLLNEPQLAPKTRANCLPYGYERLMRGDPFEYYRPTSLTEGTFFGRRVTPVGYSALEAGAARIDRLASRFRREGSSRP